MALGACGWYNGAGDWIVAINSGQFDSDKPCGRQVCLSYQGRTQTARIVDRCDGCPFGLVDASPSLFSALVGGLDAGKVGITWNYGACGGGEPPAPKPTTTPPPPPPPPATTRAAPPTTTPAAPPTPTTTAAFIQPASLVNTNLSSSTTTSSLLSSTTTSVASSTSASATSIPLLKRKACYVKNQLSKRRI